jgi:WD40 repeat protein
MVEKAHQFDAFISYSHRADFELAKLLQRELHRFAKPWYQRRAVRTFRDDASLGASPALWETIEHALSQSRFLILFASPEAAASNWVQKEVDYWCTNKEPMRLLIVKTGGKIVWDDNSADFDWSASSALPPALRGRFPSEPLHLDLSWVERDDTQAFRNPRFVNVVASLAATIRDVSKDEILGEDVTQHRRTIRLARAAVVVLSMLLVAAIAAGWLAIEAGERARAEQARAEENERGAEAARSRAEEQRDLARSRQLAAVADDLRDTTLDTSLLLSLHALQAKETTSAQSALLKGLQSAADVLIYFGPGSAGPAHYFNDGRYIALKQPSTIEVIDAATGESVAIVEPDLDPWPIEAIAFSPTQNVLAVTKGYGAVQLFDTETLQPVGGRAFSTLRQLSTFEDEERRGDHLPARGLTSLAFSPDGRHLAGNSRDGWLHVWAVDGGELTIVHERFIDARGSWGSVAYLDATRIGVTRIGFVGIVGLLSGETHDLTRSILLDPTTPGLEYHRHLVAGRPAVGSAYVLSMAVGGVRRESLAESARERATRGVAVAWTANPSIPQVEYVTQSSDEVRAVAYSPDGSQLMAGDERGNLWLWESRSSALVRGPIKALGDAISTIEFHPNGREVVLSAADRSAVVISLSNARSLPAPEHEDPLFTARSVAFEPAGRYLVVGYSDGSIAAWQPAERTLVSRHTLGAPKDEAVRLRWLSDTSSFVASKADVLTLWSISPRGELAQQTTVDTRSSISALTSCPASNVVAVSHEDGTISRWDPDLSTGGDAIRLNQSTRDLAFMPDCQSLLDISEWRIRRILLGGDDGAKRLDGFVSLPNGGQAISVDSRDDTAAVGLWDGRIVWVDLKAFRRLGEPVRLARGEPVKVVRHRADGRWVLAATSHTVQLFDNESRTPIGGPFVFESPVWDAAFSPDGKTIAVALAFGSVELLDVDVGSWTRRACSIVHRELGDEEWEHYLDPQPRVAACDPEPLARATTPLRDRVSQMLVGARR